TVELFGDAASLLDPEMVRQAARAVLHYFRHDLARDWVSVAEFSAALERTLRGLDPIATQVAPPAPARVADADLRRLACESGKGCELVFFARLREALREHLRDSPQIVRFSGLRGCVKQLVGARRWTDRCQRLNDDIVDFLRGCLRAEAQAAACAMVVR
ncbi:MAG: hypothetical protein KGS61_10310, partial [Verrucomicrobia bacterium]|nr:hypothetical protein [Verrucomicrobiota bacterium]